MKKNSTLTAPLYLTLTFCLVLLLASSEIRAQSVDRVVLVEQVTSASCGPCALQNPAFDALLNSNEGKVAVIKYQRGGGSYIDPMWDFNPGEVDSRITSYYGTFSFPQVWINGEYNNTPSTVSQSTIDAAMSEPAWWDIAIDQELDLAQENLHVTVNFTALRDFQDLPDNYLRVFVVLIEEEVLYSSAPGYNGETEFHWVMRKMLPGYSGATIGQQFSGQSTEVEYDYAIDPSEIDPSKLKVVAFVQRYTTKEVLQAGMYREAGQSTSAEEISGLGNLMLTPTLADNIINAAFSTAEAAEVMFEIYNMQGQLVEQLDVMSFPAGNHSQSFVLDNYEAGSYFLAIRSESDSRVAKFMVVD